MTLLLTVIKNICNAILFHVISKVILSIVIVSTAHYVYMYIWMHIFKTW